MAFFPWGKAARVAVGVVAGGKDNAGVLAEQVASILAERDARHAEELREERTRYHELVHELLSLVKQQQPVAHVPQPSAMDALGPLTHAALAEMGRGQARDIRVAMQQKALALHAAQETDENIASAILRGEPVRL
jgi:hypothetical protein